MTPEQKKEFDELNEALSGLGSVGDRDRNDIMFEAAQSYRDHFAEIQALKSGEWVLVPIMPTSEMIGAACFHEEDWIDTHQTDVYELMIAARPKLEENNE